jgi:hypothetical protein
MGMLWTRRTHTSTKSVVLLSVLVRYVDGITCKFLDGGGVMAEGYKSADVPDLEWWINQITQGIAFRKKYAYEEKWSTWRSWNRGQFQRGQIPDNIYFKFIRSLVPRTYFRNPSIAISATKPGLDYFLLSKLLERVDNKLMDHMGIKGQMKSAVLKATMFGTGFIFRGYGSEFAHTPIDITTQEPDAGTRKMRNRVEYNDLIRDNQPWALDTHPGSVIFPAYTPNVHAARWVCQEIIRSRDDVLDDPRLENKDGLEQAMKGQKAGKLIASGMDDRTRSGIRLWVVRDKKTGLVFVLAPYTPNGIPNTMVKPMFLEEDKLQRNGRLPCYPLIFNEDDEQCWGVPDSIIIEPQQYEINEINTQIRSHRRVLLKKFLYQRGMVDPDELDKLLADDNVNIGIAVQDVTAVRPMEAGGLPPGLVEGKQLINQNVQELLGLGVNQFGEYAPGSADRSATETQVVNQASQIRTDERRDAGADLITDLITDMNDDITEYWGEEMLADVAGPAGVPIWIKFQPELLRNASWDVKVDPDSSVPLTKQYKEQKAQQVYATLYGKNQSANPEELTRWYLSEMYGTEADSIIMNPAMNTTPQNPMSLPQAMQHIQQLPQSARAAVGQPQGNVVPGPGAVRR